MTYQEAMEIVENHPSFKHKIIVSGFDFPEANLFVFNLRLIDSPEKDILDNTIAVNKATHNVFVFQPFQYSPSEYMNAAKNNRLPI